VRLDFSENYWQGADRREFNVLINGTQVLTNFDIFATAGAEFKAISETFSATPNSAGKIVIQFVTVLNYAKVDGIQIIH
jgi:beta-galactosidase